MFKVLIKTFKNFQKYKEVKGMQTQAQAKTVLMVCKEREREKKKPSFQMMKIMHSLKAVRLNIIKHK
jgi:hypothetical protein